ncbi:tail X family protein [Escherichia coli]|uniref:Tail X family protein n=1 Tax=Escherichia coli TaxID=562 RepID=A0A377AWI0_ECOLX|nr:tail X family protein [Escherichia coli]
MKVRAHQYDTVDALCWRHYGRHAGCHGAGTEGKSGACRIRPLFTSRAAGGAAGHSDYHHRADRPAMGLNYDA